MSYQLPFEEKAEPAVRPQRRSEKAQPEPEIYTVSRLNREVRQILESSFPFIWVEGEISNFRHHSSGHMYFTLKDESAELDAVMFEDLNAYLQFEPADGMKVLAYGQVTLYERRGIYQLEVEEMRPAGIGRLQLEFDRLKAKLSAEGLFDERFKVQIPAFSQRIGVVTSPEGAAIRDIISVISRKFHAVELLLFPARVQGEGAPEEIAFAIESANLYSKQVEKIDTLIVGRGGGSLEDLWAFNEECVARAIFSSEIPVISAVGHEIDFTIADFVADCRAPTPAIAAELAVPDRDKLLEGADSLTRRLMQLLSEKFSNYRQKLEVLLQSYVLRRPLQRLKECKQTSDQLIEQMIKIIGRKLKTKRDWFAGLLARLDASNPLAILKRGYSITQNAQGQIVKSTTQVKEHERVQVRLFKGRLICEVEEIEHESEH